MKVYIASDHRGYKLKKEIVDSLKKEYDIVDLGTNSTSSVDYPDYAFKLGEKVVKDDTYGIAICGSGIGISIACNKVKGVRCAKVNSIKEVKMTRLDNDSNIIAMSSQVSPKRAIRLIEEFLTTKFSKDSRHIRRIKKIEEYEQKN